MSAPISLQVKDDTSMKITYPISRWKANLFVKRGGKREEGHFAKAKKGNIFYVLKVEKRDE